MRTSPTLISMALLVLLCGCRTFQSATDQRRPTDTGQTPVESGPDATKAGAPLPGNVSEGPRPLPPVSGTGPSDELRAATDRLVAAGRLDSEGQRHLLDDLQHTNPALRQQVLNLLATSLDDGSQNRDVSGDAPPAISRAPRLIDPPIDRSTVRKARYEEPSTKYDSTIEEQADHAHEPAAESARSEEPDRSQASTTPVSAAPAPVRSWRDHLSAAIEGASAELDAQPQSSEEIAQHALLRLMYLADGNRDEALRPIPGVPPAQQDFWSKGLFGLSTYLDVARNPHSGRRAAEAAGHLREATTRLGELANLSIRNMSFCSEVKSYGIYTRFDKYEFAPSQEVLIYAEVENFKIDSTDKGYHTALRASYEILDASGARVDEHEFPLTEEHCQNPRRDYFVRYFITIPPRIYGGRYKLQLYLTDENSQKMDQGTLEFSVRTKE